MRAATTEESTPPDMATTTRVRAGALARPSEFKGASIARLGASMKSPARPTRALGRQNGYYCAGCKRNGANRRQADLGGRGSRDPPQSRPTAQSGPGHPFLIIKSKQFRAF